MSWYLSFISPVSATVQIPKLAATHSLMFFRTQLPKEKKKQLHFTFMLQNLNPNRTLNICMAFLSNKYVCSLFKGTPEQDLNK